MQLLTNITRTFLSSRPTSVLVQKAGLRVYAVPPKREDVEQPERAKLRVMPREPTYPPQIRPFLMQKKLKLMRGEEKIHNTLLHKQYGIIALMGGRLKFGHLEMMRMTLVRKLDYNKCFAVWRVDPPWQPVTKKSQGMRMGGGKGSIHHYVTPIKAGRVIVEVGGRVEFYEVKRTLDHIAQLLPFKAMTVSQKMLDDMKAKEKWLEENNLNPWTWKYIIQNNMSGCHNWISPFDKLWFNKHR